jgi:hypothetical protein
VSDTDVILKMLEHYGIDCPYEAYGLMLSMDPDDDGRYHDTYYPALSWRRLAIALCRRISESRDAWAGIR